MNAAWRNVATSPRLGHSQMLGDEERPSDDPAHRSFNGRIPNSTKMRPTFRISKPFIDEIETSVADSNQPELL